MLGAFEHQDRQAGTRQIRRDDRGVVAAAEYDGVVAGVGHQC
jgi:hypothetical protein